MKMENLGWWLIGAGCGLLFLWAFYAAGGGL